jgi:hypothetical protein
VRLEGLGKLKGFIHLIWSRTRDLPACSIVPQPTTLPRDNIKMDLRIIGREAVNMFTVAQDRDQLRTVVNVVMNIRVPLNAGISFSI